jgi:hypothetical protein
MRAKVRRQVTRRRIFAKKSLAEDRPRVQEAGFAMHDFSTGIWMNLGDRGSLVPRGFQFFGSQSGANVFH